MGMAILEGRSLEVIAKILERGRGLGSWGGGCCCLYGTDEMF